MSRWSPSLTALLLPFIIVAGCARADVRPIGTPSAGQSLREEQAGRKCGACGTAVHGMQEVSAFEKPKRTFGHADCGGMRLSR